MGLGHPSSRPRGPGKVNRWHYPASKKGPSAKLKENRHLVGGKRGRWRGNLGGYKEKDGTLAERSSYDLYRGPQYSVCREKIDGGRKASSQEGLGRKKWGGGVTKIWFLDKGGGMTDLLLMQMETTQEKIDSRVTAMGKRSGRRRKKNIMDAASIPVGEQGPIPAENPKVRFKRK